MIEAKFGSYYRKWLVNPVANRIARFCRAEMITAIAFLSGLLVIPLLYVDIKILATAMLLLSGYCDSLDGTVARLTHSVSRKGAILDIAADRIVEFATVLALLLIDVPNRGLTATIMLGSIFLCVTSFLLAGIYCSNNKRDKGFYYSPGLIERPEAFIFFILMIWLPYYFNALALIFSLLTFYTAGNRINQLVRFCEKEANEVKKVKEVKKRS
jgi:phosphatidylglycerophosphate synthase